MQKIPVTIMVRASAMVPNNGVTGGGSAIFVSDGEGLASADNAAILLSDLTQVAQTLKDLVLNYLPQTDADESGLYAPKSVQTSMVADTNSVTVRCEGTCRRTLT